MWAEKGKDPQQFLYLPALKRTNMIAPTKMGESFMGSEFSFYDMSSRDVSKENYKLLKEEKHKGHDCYKIQSIPQDKILYSKLILWIRKDNYIPIHVKFYSLSGGLAK